MRYVLLICYDGTDFSGFQRQPNGRTVQETLELAAENIFGAPVKIAGSGRTDAGVHALGQVCHLDGETSIPAHKLRECFNRILPPDVKVLESAAAPAGFDCTRGAKRKTYVYSFYCAPTELPLYGRYYARVKEEPDEEKMRAAARLLVGEHDFKAFCASGSSAKTSVRKIYSVKIIKKRAGNASLYSVEVCGNGFLYNMVRILVGELVAVGLGKEEGITRAFETGERSALARTMPPNGLILKSVNYGRALFAPPKE